VKLLVTRGADVNGKVTPSCFAPRIPLKAACASGNVEVVKLLIERGADINKEDSAHETPLIAASLYGHKEVVELLIERGAEINTPDEKGKTPLELAQTEEIKALLRSRGARD
jgi:ankyrin repeat protein